MPTRSFVRSTDGEYIYGRFVRLAEPHRLEFLPNDSASFVARWTAGYAIRRLCSMAGLHLSTDDVVTPLRIPKDADLVFSYGIFPKDSSSNTPIVWEQTFGPPSLDVRDDDLVATLRRSRTWAVAKAATIVTATEVSVEWIRRVFPEARDRVHWVPYYLPDLEASDATMTSAKFAEDRPLRVLFVGKQGRRKGLDTLVAAYDALPFTLQNKMDVTVVSRMIDGSIRLPASFRHHLVVPDVLALMRTADVLVFPTKHEAFGLVLVEAMASGCAIVTTKAPIQRSIVGDAGGLFVDPRGHGELCDALRILVGDRERCLSMASANLRRFRAKWHHAVVGDRYATLFREAAGRPAMDASTARPDLES